MEWLPSTCKHLLLSPFKLNPLEFALTILIAERIQQCTVEKVFKEKRRNASGLKCGLLIFSIWTAWKKWLADIYIYTLGNLLNNVCCENKNIKNKFLNKRYFATYVAFSSSHGRLYIYIHVNMFYLVLFINTDTLEQCI